MTGVGFDRERLGRVHMDSWCGVARSIPGLDRTRFLPWDQHSEANREADMFAAEAVAAEVLGDPRLIVLEVPTADQATPVERGQNFGGCGARLEDDGRIRITGTAHLSADAALRFAAYVATCARVAESRDAEVDELTKVILASRAADSTEGPTARAAAQAVIAAGWKRETPA